jgi:hypothetical protein
MRRFGLAMVAVLGVTGVALAQLGWPVRGAIGQTWDVNVQGIGSWTLRLTQTDNEGTVFGQATGTDNREGYFEYVQQQNLTVLWLDKSATDSYGCVIAQNDVRGNAVSGNAVRFTGQNTPLQNLRAACNATLQNAQLQTPPAPPAPQPPAPQPPAPQPPAPGPLQPAPSSLNWPVQLSVGQNYTATIQGVNTWNVSLTATNGTAFNGTATPTQGGANLQASFFNRPDVDSSELDLTDGNQMYSCLFTGRSSIQNGALVGKTFYRANSSAQFQDFNRTCEVRPVTTQTQVGPTPLPQPPAPQPPAPQPPTPQTPPTPPAPGPLTASWPPQTGQVWQLNINGLVPWTVTFTGLDSDGDPEGTGVQSGSSNKAFAYRTEGGLYVVQVANREGVYVCAFERLNINGATINGGQTLFRAPNAQSFQNANRACTFTLQSSPSAGSSGNTNPVNTNPVNTSSSSALVWPNLSKVGQTWGIAIQTVGQWTLPLTQLSDKGNPIGRATGTDARVGYFEYFRDDDTVLVWLDGDRDYYGCAIERSGVRGTLLVGEAYKGIGSADPSPIGQQCSVTLQSQTLSVQTQLERWLNPSMPRAFEGSTLEVAKAFRN